MVTHQHMSTCSFVLCDANAGGFPVRYASPHFVDLYGYSSAECLGKPCGTLVGGPSILANPPDLAKAICGTEWDLAEAKSAILCLTNHAAEECRKALTGLEALDSSNVGFSVLVNRKKDGTLFVCELILRVQRHPSLGWSYFVGLQKDITDEVPLKRILGVARTHEYYDLLRDRQASMDYRLLIPSNDEAIRYMNEKAGEMFCALMTMPLANHGSAPDSGKLKPKSARSVGNRSTISKASTRSGASDRSCLSASSAGSWSGSIETGCLDSLAWQQPLSNSPDSDLLEEKQGEEPTKSKATAVSHRNFITYFSDLLDEVEGAESDSAEAVSIALPAFFESTAHDEQLRMVVNGFCLQELVDLDYAFTVADPSLPDCPLVACSAGFSRLSGYTLQEVVGQNCRLLLRGVPPALVDAAARKQCRGFCSAVASGADFSSSGGPGAFFAKQPKPRWALLPEGETIVLQKNATKWGELFTGVIHLKQIELDDRMFIIGLQGRLPDEVAALEDNEQKCGQSLALLQDNLDSAIQVLTSLFWYRAPMRRQSAEHC